MQGWECMYIQFEIKMVNFQNFPDASHDDIMFWSLDRIRKGQNILDLYIHALAIHIHREYWSSLLPMHQCGVFMSLNDQMLRIRRLEGCACRAQEDARYNIFSLSALFCSK